MVWLPFHVANGDVYPSLWRRRPMGHVMGHKMNQTIYPHSTAEGEAPAEPDCS
jgi:hypothetical protein